MDKKCDIHNIEQISRLCFYSGLGIGFIGLFGMMGIVIFHVPILEMVPPCLFYKETGYYCPGCGGTRAVNALFHGRIIESICYHPFVIYILAYYFFYEVSHMLNIITHGKVKGFRFCPMCFYVGIAIIILQWIMKNYLKFQYGFSL